MSASPMPLPELEAVPVRPEPGAARQLAAGEGASGCPAPVPLSTLAPPPARSHPAGLDPPLPAGAPGQGDALPTATSPPPVPLPAPAGTADPPRYLISDLCATLDGYLPPDQVREVYRAYLFGAEAHQGQTRKSGEPYIFHPLAVARVLAEMRLDHRCLMAAILHDVIEDTETAKEHLARLFGDEVAELVDGVSKLTQIDFKSRAEAQAANLRKMMLAMTRDIRVILIKLADRLHNMRTLDAMAPEKRRRISRETLDIYAPIANRLGLNQWRLELEELGFRHHWPWRHAVLGQALRKARANQHDLLERVQRDLRERLGAEQIDGEVYGREKHPYSVYRKMQAKQQGKQPGKRRAFTDVVDVYAFRVIVDRVDTCYRVLGQVHSMYRPVPGRFKDYIAIPKSNGYQALHTVLAGPQGAPLEVQIRTRDMERMAAAGIAAHWQYKNADDGGVGPARDWLTNLLELQRNAGDSQEFLAQVKIDLFPDEVYVFTPKGQIRVLPKGATVVDFAYAIHSDVGNGCVAARIDRHLVPLRTQLRSGQTVEIITSPAPKPNAGWLNFVVTGKARASIRAWLRNVQQQEAEALGRRMLSAALDPLGLDLEQVGAERLAAYAAELGLADTARLLAEIGLGNRVPMLVARRLADAMTRAPAPVSPTPPVEAVSGPDLTTVTLSGHPADPGAAAGNGGKRLAIRGTEGMVVAFARCCRPIPGDPITGLFSPGKGIVVHASDCRNLGDYQARRDSWIEVDWAPDLKAEFSTEIRVEANNRRGALATIAAAIADEGSNIETVQSRDKDGSTSTLDFLINVQSRAHLATIMRRLRKIPLVVRITRLSNGRPVGGRGGTRGSG